MATPEDLTYWRKRSYFVDLHLREYEAGMISEEQARLNIIASLCQQEEATRAEITRVHKRREEAERGWQLARNRANEYRRLLQKTEEERMLAG